MALIDRIKGSGGSSAAKIILIGLLILILMIPTVLIKEVIYDRRNTQDSAVSDVSEKWGSAQTLQGPIITVPYLRWAKANRNNPNEVGQVHLLPETLNIDGKIIPEIRSRGIFEVPLYTADLNISGTFNKDSAAFPVPANQILWQDAVASIGITDMRGIREQVKIKFNEADVSLKSGLSQNDVFYSGVKAKLADFGSRDSHNFSLKLILNGSQMINFVPIGKETKVNVNSTWENPSFDGAFLPTERNVTDEGFTANWSVLDVNRNYPQVWVDQTYETYESQFGLKLFMPVESYQKTIRSIKYAILFITLTFLAFFLSEVLNNFRIHPIQYLLIGFAILLFYLLLLSFSEQIGFGWAYLLASIGIIGMISLYSTSVLRIKKLGYLIGGLLAVLYAFLYFLLQTEDMALLLGSIGLFLILGVVMYLTRNIDWYTMKKAD